MSYFEFSRGQVEQLVDAYEDLVDKLSQVYYNQDDDAIVVYSSRIQEILRGLGLDHQVVPVNGR